MNSEKYVGEHVDASGFVGRDQNLSTRDPFQFVDGILRSPAQIQDLLGELSEDTARSRQRDACAEPFKQSCVQLLFELPDLRTDCRLRTVTGLCGFGKAFQPNDFQERM